MKLLSNSGKLMECTKLTPQTNNNTVEVPKNTSEAKTHAVPKVLLNFFSFEPIKDFTLSSAHENYICMIFISIIKLSA